MPKQNTKKKNAVQKKAEQEQKVDEQNRDNAVKEQTVLATAKTAIDIKLYKATTKAMDAAILLFYALAILFFGIWIVLFFGLHKKDYLFLILFFIILICQVCFYFFKQHAKKGYTKGIENHYIFYKKHIVLTTYTNNVLTGSKNISYADIVGRKYIAVFQDAGYLVLHYKTKITPLYIHLQSTPIEQIEKLQQIFKIKLLK